MVCNETHDICVVGLGFVGLTFAAFCAERGYRVFGTEKNKVILSRVKEGRAHFYEDGLDEVISANVQAGRLSSEERLPPRTGDQRVYVVTVGTPLRGDASIADLGAIDAVAEAISAQATSEDLVIFRSTMRVGTAQELQVRWFSSSRVMIAVCPERTIEGRALEELQTLPQIVGGIGDEASDTAQEFFRSLGVECIPVKHAEEAELAKLVCNAERDVEFAFANEVAMLCEAWNLRFDSVRAAVNDGYPRANLRIPGPAAGPCLEKDGHILVESGLIRRFNPRVVEAARTQNEHLVDHVIARVLEVYRQGKEYGEVPHCVGILGLAFKGHPATDDTRGSLAITIAQKLQSYAPKIKIMGYDPELDIAKLAGIIEVVHKIETTISHADVIIIQTNHYQLIEADWPTLLGLAKPGVFVYDLWGVIKQSDADFAHVRYRRLGQGGD